MRQYAFTAMSVNQPTTAETRLIDGHAPMAHRRWAKRLNGRSKQLDQWLTIRQQIEWTILPIDRF